MKKKKAFTIVELLVVIAILAIIISVAIPAFRSASKSAKEKSSPVSHTKTSQTQASSGNEKSNYTGEVPSITRRVTDYTGILSSNEVAQLESKLEQYEKTTSNQIAVMIVNSLEGKDLDEFSIAIAEKAKLGQKGKDNGVLVFIARNDRKIKIEVGYGLEGALPDGMCGRIMDNEFLPFFKKDEMYNGINNGVDKIMLAIKNEYTADTTSRSNNTGNNEDVLKLLGIAFVILFLFSGFCGIFHPIAGGVAGAIGSFFIVKFFYSFMWAIPAAVIGFLIGMIAKDILEGMASGSGGGGSYGRGSSWSSGSSHSSGSSFSGGGGHFGGGGASRSW
ncbi:MAG: TPM domain-containing protein [Candidatus Nanoarchaeia archaeon]|nr:TPM domain-containing protein [Candidatus Nanoarchaeia archaeon]